MSVESLHHHFSRMNGPLSATLAAGVLGVFLVSATVLGSAPTESPAPADASPPAADAARIPSSVGLTAANCNLTTIQLGGGGRCYPGCVTDEDCTDRYSGPGSVGYVASRKECAARAASVCGDDAACAERICGSATPTCREGVCSRPFFPVDGSLCDRTTPRSAASSSTPVPGVWRGICPGAEEASTDCTAADLSRCVLPPPEVF